MKNSKSKFAFVIGLALGASSLGGCANIKDNIVESTSESLGEDAKLVAMAMRYMGKETIENLRKLPEFHPILEKVPETDGYKVSYVPGLEESVEFDKEKNVITVINKDGVTKFNYEKGLLSETITDKIETTDDLKITEYKAIIDYFYDGTIEETTTQIFDIEPDTNKSTLVSENKYEGTCDAENIYYEYSKLPDGTQIIQEYADGRVCKREYTIKEHNAHSVSHNVYDWILSKVSDGKCVEHLNTFGNEAMTPVVTKAELYDEKGNLLDTIDYTYQVQSLPNGESDVRLQKIVSQNDGVLEFWKKISPVTTVLFNNNRLHVTMNIDSTNSREYPSIYSMYAEEFKKLFDTIDEYAIKEKITKYSTDNILDASKYIPYEFVEKVCDALPNLNILDLGNYGLFFENNIGSYKPQGKITDFTVQCGANKYPTTGKGKENDCAYLNYLFPNLKCLSYAGGRDINKPLEGLEQVDVEKIYLKDVYIDELKVSDTVTGIFVHNSYIKEVKDMPKELRYLYVTDIGNDISFSSNSLSKCSSLQRLYLENISSLHLNGALSNLSTKTLNDLTIKNIYNRDYVDLGILPNTVTDYLTPLELLDINLSQVPVKDEEIRQFLLPLSEHSNQKYRARVTLPGINTSVNPFDIGVESWQTPDLNMVSVEEISGRGR